MHSILPLDAHIFRHAHSFIQRSRLLIQAAELMRNYSGWSAANVTALQALLYKSVDICHNFKFHSRPQYSRADSAYSSFAGSPHHITDFRQSVR